MQVFSTEQWVIMIVYAYPFFYALDTSLDSLAAAHDAPPAEQIMAGASEHSMDVKWAIMDEYLRQITAHYCHESVPLPREMQYAEQHADSYTDLLTGVTSSSAVSLRNMLF